MTVVRALGLAPSGMTKVQTASDLTDRDVYLVDILLPNGVTYPNFRVTEARLQGADVLIGMDVIGTGDLSITNVDGKTTFSFRFPSLKEIDYVVETAKGGGIPQNRSERRHPRGNTATPAAGTREPRGGGTAPPRRAST
jgi:hypothetical protein